MYTYLLQVNLHEYFYIKTFYILLIYRYICTFYYTYVLLKTKLYQISFCSMLINIFS